MSRGFWVARWTVWLVPLAYHVRRSLNLFNKICLFLLERTSRAVAGFRQRCTLKMKCLKAGNRSGRICILFIWEFFFVVKRKVFQDTRIWREDQPVVRDHYWSSLRNILFHMKVNLQPAYNVVWYLWNNNKYIKRIEYFWWDDEKRFSS